MENTSKYSVLAIVSLVTGILSVSFLYIFLKLTPFGYMLLLDLIVGILSTVLGIISIKEIKKTERKGKSAAIIGIFLGGFVIFVLLVLMLIGFALSGAGII